MYPPKRFVKDATTVFERAFDCAKERKGPLAEDVFERIDIVAPAIGLPFETALKYHFNECFHRVLGKHYWTDLTFPKDNKEFYERMGITGIKPDYFLTPRDFKSAIGEIKGDDDDKLIAVDLERQQARIQVVLEKEYTFVSWIRFGGRAFAQEILKDENAPTNSNEMPFFFNLFGDDRSWSIYSKERLTSLLRDAMAYIDFWNEVHSE